MEICAVCSSPADNSCSACRSVSYCSVDHQKKHWKQHKLTCRVWKVEKNDIFGRYIVAARDISPGSVIMDEEALAIGPKQESRPICLGCHKWITSDKYRCSKCAFPMCSLECEQLSMHADNECTIFKKKPNKFTISDYSEAHPAYECILTVRCLMLKKARKDKWDKLMTMEHHNSIRQQLPELWNRNEHNTVQLLRGRYEMNEFDAITIHSIMGFADVNAFEIKCSGIEICGLFRDVGLLAHECISNTHHSITDDYHMVVRAAVPIRKGDMITTTYAHGMDGSIERRKFIKESKFFDCVCPRCSDPTEVGTYMSAIVCSRQCEPNGKQMECPCSGFLLPKDSLNPESLWICTECNNSMTVTEVSALVGEIRSQMPNLMIPNENNIPTLERIMDTYSGKVVHPNHFLMVDILHTLSQSYGRATAYNIKDLSKELLHRKVSLCRRFLSILDVIEPGLSRIRGWTMYELHAPLYFIAQDEFQRNEITSDTLKIKLEEVIQLLEESGRILSFDSPNTSPQGHLCESIPESIEGIRRIINHFCK